MRSEAAPMKFPTKGERSLVDLLKQVMLQPLAAMRSEATPMKFPTKGERSLVDLLKQVMLQMTI